MEPSEEAAIEVASSSEAVKPATRSHEEIAVLAYAYWETRERQDGSAEGDWLRAEQALANRMLKASHAVAG